MDSILSCFPDLLGDYNHLLVSISPNLRPPQVHISRDVPRRHSWVKSRQSEKETDNPYANCALVVHAEEHRDRIPLYTGAIDCSVDGALEDVICPSGHAIRNVDYKGSL
jgi:hypothetical protein